MTPFFPSRTAWQGGFCMDAVKSLQRDGRYEVLVFTATDYGGDYEINGIKVFCFQRRVIRSEYFETILATSNNKLFLRKLMSTGISPLDIAVCHVHDYEHYIQYALAIKRINKNCLTLVHHHFAGYYRLGIGKLGLIPIWSDLLYMKMKREFESVDAHIFISEHCRRHYGKAIDFDTGEERDEVKNQLMFGKFFSSITCPDSYVWYNGIDYGLFPPKNVSSGNKDFFVVGCVANFNPCKSQLDLIRAIELLVERMPDIRLHLLGSGTKYFEICKQYVERHNLGQHVKFMSPMSHDKLAGYYHSIDLFVMPSVNEGFCCVNAEANACGIPVIAIKGLPIEEILSDVDRQDCLVPPHDIKAIAGKIMDFRKRPRCQKFTLDLNSDHLATQFLNWVDKKVTIVG